MNPTRRLKNSVLCFAITMLFTIVILKLGTDPSSVSSSMKLWSVPAPVVVLATLFTPSTSRWAKPVHLMLFLCTGAAIGFTLGGAIRGEPPLLIGEWVWLPVGFAAAVLHYWPSNRDQYAS